MGFYFIVFFGFIVVLAFHIANIIRFLVSIINKIKNKNDLEKYNNAKKETYELFKINMINLYLLEIWFFILNFENRCACGITPFKAIPQILCIIIQIVLYKIFRKFIEKRNKGFEENTKTLYLVMCIILSIVSFVIVLFLNINEHDLIIAAD
jgi:membrane protein insertase Oxa1/YidC/SpoIIIJ